jgi:GAF domain
MDIFYDFFIGRFKGQVEDYAKAKLIVNFSIVEILVSIFYILIGDTLSFHSPSLLYVVFITLISLSLFAFKWGVPLKIMAQILIGTFWATIMIAIGYSGGIYSLIAPWLALMPIMSNLLLDRKIAKWWALISLLSVIYFLIFFKGSTILNDQYLKYRTLVGHVGLIIIIFSFSDLFRASINKLFGALKKSNAYLKEEQEEVLAQNEELSQQRDDIAAKGEHIERQNKLLREQNELVEKINMELAKKAKEIFERNTSIEKHWHTLLSISKNKSVNFGDFEEAIKLIVRTLANSLQIDRVSIWQFEPDRKSLQCLVLYELEGESYSQEEALLLKDFPRYFEALEEEKIIPADDAESDIHTFEFKDSYLKPRHIVSMMDSPYFLDGKLGGVICCEQLTHRHWLPEDIIFAQALSDIISLVYKSVQRKEYESKIRTHKKELARFNFNLEQSIQERTKELERQNRQLAEYAFINSHLLRGPLCRMLGLIYLIDHTEIRNKEKDLIDHLKLSGEELDEVVRKINSAIEKGGHFNREEFGNFGRNQ